MSCLVGLSLSVLAGVAGADRETDVIIYGGTSAGVAAAVQVARMGRTVIMVSPDEHLGGLSSGGLGWTDTGRKEVIGGIAREFYQRVKKHYDQPGAWVYQDPKDCSRYRPEEDALWVFEPHVAEQVFEDLIAEHHVPVYRGEWLDREHGVQKEGARLAAITTLRGNTYRGKMFIDATYEGDLMAAAGVSYHVGREANSVYGETLNGVQTRNAVSHQFEKPVDPYVVPGDPSSGLLPRVHDGSPGEEGADDRRIQAYCFRMCLTNVAENRLPFPKPEGYDPSQYELLARYLATGWEDVFGKFDLIPNGKTDTNNRGAFSTDNIGMNYDYPEGSYERRREIVQEHETYQKGLMWFLANDARVPVPIRTEMSRWGLAKDEFIDNGHWPHQIYVREARRMVSDFVMTELHLRGQKDTPESIGMGSYNMDSHNTQRYVALGKDGAARVLNEGDVQVSPGRAYPISYGAIVPKASEATNLLVPVCVSSSHIAYGSIRMEPVFMILGQSAATAAVQAIEEDAPVQDISYDKLRQRLLDDRQCLLESPAASAGAGTAASPAGSSDSEQPTERSILLWPGTPPGPSSGDAFRPWLEPFPIETDAPRGAVLICPGGGYGGRAPHEGTPIAKRFNEAGMHAFVVQYRVAPSRHPAPLTDVSRALRIIRDRAEAWKVSPDHVAVLGFSAGGHLAASLGVFFDEGDPNAPDPIDRLSSRPDALVLCYPVISFGEYGHLGSARNLLGDDASEDMLRRMSLQLRITENTPPTFIWHTANDEAVPVENSLLFAQALSKHKVPFELHVYPKGQHGLGLAQDDPHVGGWVNLSCEWLRAMGW